MKLDRTRIVYVALAIATIAVGLAVHRSTSGLSPTARDILGDALWAAMIVWWVGALLPRVRPLPRSGIAYAICAAVEISQLYHGPAIDAIRDTQLGQLVLGSGFDPRDLVAYGIGVAAALLLDSTVVSRRRERI